MKTSSSEQLKETRGEKRPTMSIEKVLSIVEKIRLQEASLEHYQKGSPVIERLKKSIEIEKSELENLYKQLTPEQRILLKKSLKEKEAHTSKTNEKTVEATTPPEPEAVIEEEAKETKEATDRKMVIFVKEWEGNKGYVDQPKTFSYQHDDTYIQMLATSSQKELERFWEEGKHRLAKRKQGEEGEGEIAIEKDPKRLVVHAIEDSLAERSPGVSNAWHIAMYGEEGKRRAYARSAQKAEQLKTVDAIRKRKSDKDAPHRMEEGNPYQWRIDTAQKGLEQLQREIKRETDLAETWKKKSRAESLQDQITIWGKRSVRFESEQREKRDTSRPSLGILETLDAAENAPVILETNEKFKKNMAVLCQRLEHARQKNQINDKEYNAVMSFLHHLFVDAKSGGKKPATEAEEALEEEAVLTE